jgi:hypothetical protein
MFCHADKLAKMSDLKARLQRQLSAHRSSELTSGTHANSMHDITAHSLAVEEKEEVEDAY